MGRIYAIDYGRARIGLAHSDKQQIIASPAATIKAGKTLEASVEAVLSEVKLNECDCFVIGLPLHMSGKESEISQEVRAFALLLEEKTGKQVHFIDERMSSLEVDRTLRENALRRKKRAKVIDTLSATVLLQAYLDRL